MTKYFTYLTFIIMLVSTSVLSAKKQPMTLEQLVETKSIVNVQVSPNGKHIAYTQLVPRDVYVDKDGKPYVELYITDENDEARRFISGKKRIGSISWGPHSQFIYFITQRGDDEYASIYKIPVDGGEAEKVVEAENDISAYSINHNATALTYIAKPKKPDSVEKLSKKGFKAKIYEESNKKNSAYYVDLKSPKASHLRLNTDEHVLSVQYHPKKDSLLTQTAPTSAIDDKYVASQYRVLRQDGSQSQVFKTEGKLGAAKWSPDGKRVAIIGAENKNDPASGRLFVGNARTGKLTEQVKGYQGHVKGIQWLSSYKLAFLGHVGTKSEVSEINIDSNSVTQIIPQGGSVLFKIHADTQGTVFAGVASSHQHPRELVKLSKNKVKRLSHSNPWMDKAIMPLQKTVEFKARDGVDLQGVLIYPTNYSKRKRYPLIMMVHGGPEAHVSDGWLDKYSYPIKHAAANGFAVFLPNYRGSTGRGVEFSKMGQADYAGAEFNDLVDAITHLSKIGLVDKKRVGITGGSYGGYASAWAATALSEHFAASVMFVGISNQLSKFGTTDIPKEMYNVHARNYPWDKWQWMLERSPIYHTRKAKTPILIMHGENDTRVHPAQSMELYRYIKTRTDTPVRLVYYPGEPHGNKKAASQLDYSMRLMRWMEFYLKGENKGQQIPPYELEHEKGLVVEDKDK